MLINQDAVPAVRLFDGAPILRPTPLAWENGATFNAAVTFLPPGIASVAKTKLIAAASLYGDPRLANGIVAVHYRARPLPEQGILLTKSFVGLALFTPTFELLYRFAEPLISPDANLLHPDSVGVEDPRVTQIGDSFHMVYCGCHLDNESLWTGSLCGAHSTDLLTWTKTGPLRIIYRKEDACTQFDNTYFNNMPALKGSSRRVSNKDGVLLPDRIDGRQFLLHRPMFGHMRDWAIHLAYTTDSIAGDWHNCGPILHAAPDPAYTDSWLGAGAVPIPLGDNRYLAIIHTGNLAADLSRYYTLDAVVLDFNKFDPAAPDLIVESRLDRFMVPATKYEIEGPNPDSVGNVLFSCGAFVRDGELSIVYGGGDTYLMAARVNLAALLEAMSPVIF